MAEPEEQKSETPRPRSGQTLDTTQLARLFDCTPRHLQRLTADGVLTRARDEDGNEMRGRYEVARNVLAYVRYLKGLARIDDASESEWARLRNERMRAESEMAGLKLKELKGELLRKDDVEFVMTNIITATKNHLLAIASRLARSLVGLKSFTKIREKISAEMERALRELSEWNPSMFKQKNSDYLKGQGADPTSLNGKDEPDEEDEAA